ncbi:hypothetical protein LOK49_LG15G00139 [Camellia lanceoleosa]|uniref:Uncharacterized protein n=1 Tax=Camellia lanceoleosa TaxID=1840588 RepID=A0ACC0F4N4_9ERIC|nr:hypothetical protein LOK49_LG15G00139 [Camellia lanceoleosa]
MRGGEREVKQGFSSARIRNLGWDWSGTLQI